MASVFDLLENSLLNVGEKHFVGENLIKKWDRKGQKANYMVRKRLLLIFLSPLGFLSRFTIQNPALLLLLLLLLLIRHRW